LAASRRLGDDAPDHQPAAANKRMHIDIREAGPGSRIIDLNGPDKVSAAAGDVMAGT
jgi:hypothetical protein